MTDNAGAGTMTLGEMLAAPAAPPPVVTPPPPPPIVPATPAEAHVDRAIAGHLDDGPVQTSSHMQMVGAAAWMRELGINDGVIRQTLTNYEVTQVERDAVAQKKAEWLRDPAWCKELMDGNGLHKRDLLLADIVLTSPVKKAA